MKLLSYLIGRVPCCLIGHDTSITQILPSRTYRSICKKCSKIFINTYAENLKVLSTERWTDGHYKIYDSHGVKIYYTKEELNSFNAGTN